MKKSLKKVSRRAFMQKSQRRQLSLTGASRRNYQPNELINTKQTFSLLEKRIFFLVIDKLNPSMHISQDLFKNTVITIYPARRLLKEPSYHRIKEACDQLTSKKIVYIDNKDKEFTFIVPFPKATYRNNTIKLVIYEEVIPHFLELKKGYTSYQLYEALSLSSRYSQRLYELLSQQKNFKKWTVEIKKLRQLLDVENKHKRWADLRRYVLLPAKDEINEKTSLHFEYTPLQKGKMFYSLQFFISDQKRIIPIKQETEKQVRARAKLVELGITREDYISCILQDHLPQFWQWLYHYKTNKEEIKSPVGHLLKVLGIVK